MTTLQSAISPLWQTPLELLPYDLTRGAILFAIFVAGLLLVLRLLRGTGTRLTSSILLAAVILLGFSAVARPGSEQGLVASAIGFAISFALLLPRIDRLLASGLSFAAALIVLLFSGSALIGFHAIWPIAASQRAVALEEMRRRPGDPWPRGGGHTTIAAFGVPAVERGWLELGGGFSPGFGTFGLSIWVMDADGRRLSSSDELGKEQIQTEYRRSPDGQIVVWTKTPFYSSSVTPLGSGSYELVIQPSEPTSSLQLVVRSVGPAGGPLYRVDQEPGGLVLNDRWRLELPQELEPACVGDETRDLDGCEPGSDIESASGWAFARLALSSASHRIVIEDTARQHESLLAFPSPVGLKLAGFPPSYTNRINAQVITLLGAIEGDESRPGDPINYPLSWQRDAAYIAVALARAGLVEQALPLVSELAERDFFGGFGSEADAPGLALWAIGELAAAMDSETLYRELWPHVLRKVGIVARMRSLSGAMREPYLGPIVPRAAGRDDLTLVAVPPLDGLIMGRMDWHFPRFYVNAVSYLGLIEAARFARRLGELSIAEEWLASADTLRTAYQTLLERLPPSDPELTNKRTAISALWPSDVADPETFLPVLEASWDREPIQGGEQPLWTYFTFAQAHQWLRLGNLDIVGDALDWADTSDVMRGLQVFWEGDGEENTSGQWRASRGNLDPPHVTPHYWAAAEALLLSIEMLAFFGSSDGTVVIGGGLPKVWLDVPLGAEAIGTGIGAVSWLWDGIGCLQIEGPGGVAYRTGPAFPPTTRIALNGASCEPISR